MLDFDVSTRRAEDGHRAPCSAAAGLGLRGSRPDRHDRPPRRAPWLGARLGTLEGGSSPDGVQGLPVRSRMYCRIILRTT
jgi:hypothetical protein